QTGSCASPTDEVRANLKSDGSHDIEPYRAKDGDETVVLGYYGVPTLPGFGLAAIYTDHPFSLVIADSEDGEALACGDLLEPDAERFSEAGLAVVQLLPVGNSTLQGVATIERTPLQRENDVTPTRVRIVLSEGVTVGTNSALADGYDGYVQARRCEQPTERIRINLKSRSDHDIRPYKALPDVGGEPVTLAYHGAPGAPGFGLAAAYTGHDFALVITDTTTGAPLACGDILEPDEDDFTDAGLALVQLTPSGDSAVQGYALIERIGLQRENDVTPTRVRIVLFAPPITTS
ncbi:MAG TPA: hypothetical protein VE487_14905, partial [Ilumatobacter sp.]|nr:hypothetical protein [Ilumatobacter sp.]